MGFEDDLTCGEGLTQKEDEEAIAKNPNNYPHKGAIDDEMIEMYKSFTELDTIYDTEPYLDDKISKKNWEELGPWEFLMKVQYFNLPCYPRYEIRENFLNPKHYYQGQYFRDTICGAGRMMICDGPYSRIYELTQFTWEEETRKISGKGRIIYGEQEHPIIGWEGDVIDNMRHGPGTVHFADGTKRNTHFFNDKEVDPTKMKKKKVVKK